MAVEMEVEVEVGMPMGTGMPESMSLQPLLQKGAPVHHGQQGECRHHNPPDDKGVALRNADGVLVDKVVEFGGHTPEIEVCQGLPQGVCPDLFQGRHNGGDVCTGRQETLQQGEGDISVTLRSAACRKGVGAAKVDLLAWPSTLHG